MRVLLISANKEKSPYPVAPIGLAYVALPLLKNGHAVEILDLCFVEDVNASLKEVINRFNPQIIGISIRNADNLTYPKSVFYLPEIKIFVDKLKSLNTPIIVGGSGFSLFPEAILKYLGLEFGITGEGETAFKEFVERLENGGDVYNIPNLAYLKHNIFHQNPIRFAEYFSSPAREILDNERYFELGGMANIQTKRGCPFKCIYCTYPHLDGNCIRCRDVDDILDELENMLDKYSLDYVFLLMTYLIIRLFMRQAYAKGL